MSTNPHFLHKGTLLLSQMMNVVVTGFELCKRKQTKVYQCQSAHRDDQRCHMCREVTRSNRLVKRVLMGPQNFSTDLPLGQLGVSGSHFPCGVFSYLFLFRDIARCSRAEADLFMLAEIQKSALCFGGRGADV